MSVFVDFPFGTPFVSLPSAVFNVMAQPYGAKGDGITDDTTAINAALAALVAQGYGTLYFPPGVFLISSTLVLGNGLTSSSTAPTSMRVQGAGSQSAVTLQINDGKQYAANPLTSRIKYIGTGSTSNTAVVKIPGNIDYFTMSDIEIDGNNNAGIAVAQFSLSGALFDRVLTRDVKYAHWFLTSNGYLLGSSQNTYKNCGSVQTKNCGVARGVVMGGTPSDVTALNSPVGGSGPTFSWGIQHNVWINPAIWMSRGGEGGIGVEFRNFDNCTFYGGSISGDGAAVQMSQNPNITTFPGPCYFVGCNISCNTVTNTFKTNGAFVFSAGFSPSWILPWGDNGVTLPQTIPWIAGMTISGQEFGPIKNTGASLLMTARGGFSAVANTVAETTLNTGAPFTLPAQQIIDNTIGAQNGALLRVKVTGIYSTTGTPTLDLRLKYAGATLFDTGAVTTVNNAVNQPFQMMVDLLVNNANNVVAASPQFAIGTSLQPGSIMVAPGVGISSGGVLTLTAQWGTASASNTVIVQSYTVELLKSQAFL